jgi:transcriptional regulator NrdR family protein
MLVLVEGGEDDGSALLVEELSVGDAVYAIVRALSLARWIVASRFEADTYNKRRRSRCSACRRSFTSAFNV